MEASWLRAFDGLGNRQGLAVLILTTRLFAIGPLILFCADRAMFLQLDLARVLLLAFAAVLPGMFLGALFAIGREDWGEDRDRMAVGVMLVPTVLLNVFDLGALAAVFFFGRPAIWVAYAEFFALVGVLIETLRIRLIARRGSEANPPNDEVK